MIKRKKEWITMEEDDEAGEEHYDSPYESKPEETQEGKEGKNVKQIDLTLGLRKYKNWMPGKKTGKHLKRKS